MKKQAWLMMALCIGMLPAGLRADDRTGPVVTWNAPGEGTCWQIDAAHRELGLVVTAEDDSGVKQGVIWMKAGRHAVPGDFSTWSSIWGDTFATGSSAPPVVRQTLAVLMAGRAEGVYTFVAEFADMAHHNLTYKALHVSVDFAAPTVSITSPRDGRAVCRDRSLTVSVSAGDSGCGVSQVQLYLNAVTSTTPVAVDTAPPYQLTVPKSLLTTDPLRIIVVAVDRAGRSSQAEVAVRPILTCIARLLR